VLYHQEAARCLTARQRAVQTSRVDLEEGVRPVARAEGAEGAEEVRPVARAEGAEGAEEARPVSREAAAREAAAREAEAREAEAREASAQAAEAWELARELEQGPREPVPLAAEAALRPAPPHPGPGLARRQLLAEGKAVCSC
jgi:pilus assembly protein FimV